MIDGTPRFTVAYNTTIGHRLEEARQKALYASSGNDPAARITEQNAVDLIARVWEHIEAIRFAEEFNGRIGSWALYK